MNKPGFPVAEAIDNFMDRYVPATRELEYLTSSEVLKLVELACQKMAEYGWMRGWEAARNQGPQLMSTGGRSLGMSNITTPAQRYGVHNYKSEGIGQCGLCGEQRGGAVHGC